MKQIDYLFGVKGFYEKYKKFKVSSQTDTVSSQIMKSIPNKSIKIEPVEKEYLGMDIKVCPEGKEINAKTGRCVKSKTQKVRKIKTPKSKMPKVEMPRVEIKLEPVLQPVLETEIKLTKTCPPGKEINPKTGRCVKIKTQKVKRVKTPKQKTEIKLMPQPLLEPLLEPVLQPEIKLSKSCPPGKEINPKTGRCVKIKSQKVKKIKILKTKTPKMKTLKQNDEIKLQHVKLEPEHVKLALVPKITMTKSCPEGKEINPKTGRCVKTKTQKVKKIKISKKIMEKLEQRPKTCPEGKEINPKTGRCVKTKTPKLQTRKQKIKI